MAAESPPHAALQRWSRGPLGTRARALLHHAGAKLPSRVDRAFATFEYQRHNQRRQEHLASLGLPLSERTILEVGAGVGDHTSFFIDRGCEVTTTDGRPENVKRLKARYPALDVRVLDLDPPAAEPIHASVTYCYGLLYHLGHPEEAITYLAGCTQDFLLLETCVSYGEDEAVNLVAEAAASPSQAVTGTGCRPTRSWIWARLGEHFPHVYATTTQPWHEEFPLDWDPRLPSQGLTRAVFVASHAPLACDNLVDELPRRQRRH
jgi:hypothetical protein